jgi:hypothetical protein
MGQEGELDLKGEEGGGGHMEPPNFDFDHGRKESVSVFARGAVA